MEQVNVSTQAELDAAIESGKWAVCVGGELSLITNGTESPRVSVRGEAPLRVEAWGSSQPHVVAWGSSQPRVVAWGSSQPHVEARGFVQISLLGQIVAKCSANVAVLVQGCAEVTGGKQTRVVIDTPKAWCEYYGVEVIEDVATLFKAVNENFHSPYEADYTPGTVPVADDWDGGKKECGGGLHFSPHPAMARAFNGSTTRYVACPVRLADIVVHPDGDYPEKVKARGCCAPVWEVDEYGVRVKESTHA